MIIQFPSGQPPERHEEGSKIIPLPEKNGMPSLPEKVREVAKILNDEISNKSLRSKHLEQKTETSISAYVNRIARFLRISRP